jgi:hypothetical protein
MRKFLFASILLIGVVLLIPRSFGQVVQAQATMPAGSSWHGYILIEIAPVGPFIAGVTTAQKARIHEALAMIADEHPNWPSYALQDSRWRLDNLAVIVEARFASMPTKAVAVQLVSNRSGYTVAQVNAALSFTVFAYGGTWSESRDACVAYLAAHTAEWEPTLP